MAIDDDSIPNADDRTLWTWNKPSLNATARLGVVAGEPGTNEVFNAEHPVLMTDCISLQSNSILSVTNAPVKTHSDSPCTVPSRLTSCTFFLICWQKLYELLEIILSSSSIEIIDLAGMEIRRKQKSRERKRVQNSSLKEQKSALRINYHLPGLSTTSKIPKRRL